MLEIEGFATDSSTPRGLLRPRSAISRSARTCQGYPEEEALAMEAETAAVVSLTPGRAEGPRAFVEN